MLKQSILTAALILAGTSLANATDKYEAIKEQALDAKKMRASEVYRLYKGKTWEWRDGGGHFAKRLRFTAIAGADGREAYAVGRWFPTISGKMCFRAIWTSEETRFADVTCFVHRKDGEQIYQRTGDGTWYVFKHDVAMDGDEFKKLIEGNLIAEEYAKRKTRVRASRRQR